MNFFTLLFGTLIISVLVVLAVTASFKKSINSILLRIIGEEIAIVWQKFLMFALLVVGVGAGVNVRKLEKFIAPATAENPRPDLTVEFWVLEIYRTLISTLGGMAWALLVFFLFALVAFVIVKGRENKN